MRAVSAEALRLPKSSFQGDFYYLKSVVEVTSPGATHAWIPPGLYLDAGKIVQFQVQERTLEVRSIHEEIQVNQPAPRSPIAARFPIRNVDILRKQNLDGEDTNEEELTEARRPWGQREFLQLDVGVQELDGLDIFVKDTKSVTPPEQIERDPETGSILFDIVRILSDDTQVKIRYSFLPALQNSNYESRAYPMDLESRFGYFKTHPERFDRYGRITLSDRERAQKLNRWDPTRTITYHLSADFPAHLAPLAFQAVENWNAPLQKMIGHPLIRLEKNSGQRLGDLRYNLINYDTTQYSVHGVLGYGPTVTHPITGEIRKGDVFLYGGTLRRALFNERLWGVEMGEMVRQDPRRGTTSTEPSFSTYPQPVADAIEAIPFHWGKAWPLANLETFLSMNSPGSWMEKLQAEARTERYQFTTQMDTHLLEGIRKLYEAFAGSDAKVESKIFSALVAHELGHDLGLRHNFKASSNKRHFKDDFQTASVMDYAFLAAQEPPGPREYDVAALSVGYSTSKTATQKAIAQNYYFCTDEDLFSALDPFCGQYDRGTTLQELVKSHRERYYAAYSFNNLRLDRAHFDPEDKDYLRRILTFLLPIRNIHDHADAILRANERKNYADLWYLARERIHTDEKTTNKVTVVVSEGERIGILSRDLVHGYQTTEREIDLDKIAPIVADAQVAREMALGALADIVMNSARSNYDEDDEVHRRLQVRGVLLDKLIALILIGAQTNDPLGKGKTVRLFDTLGKQGVVSLLTSLLSNIVQGKTGNEETLAPTVIADFDINLREMALLLLTQQLAVPGGSGEAMDLIRMERLASEADLLSHWPNLSEANKREAARNFSPDTKSAVEDLDFRVGIRDAYQRLFRARSGKNDVAAENARNDIRRLEVERSKRNVTFSHLYSGLYFRAKIRDRRLPFESAAGILLRDNLNRLEDRWMAAVELATESKKAGESALSKEYFDRADTLYHSYANEKLFAERLFNLYEYQKR